MNVLHLNPLSHPAYGGAARIAFELYFRQKLHCRQTISPTCWSLPDRNRAMKLWWLFAHNPMRDAFIERLVKRHNPDVVHCHDLSCLRGANNSGIPTVFSVHSSPTPQHPTATWADAPIRWWLRQRHYEREWSRCTIVCPSQWLAKQFSKSIVIPHITTIPVCDRNPSDFVLFVGRASREKGLDIVLDHAEQTWERVVVAYLPGPLANDPRMKLPNVMAICDADPLTLSKLYSEALYVWIPSRCEEAFCLVAKEAAIAGCPIKHSNKGAIAEATQSQFNDPQKWVEEYLGVYSAAVANPLSDKRSDKPVRSMGRNGHTCLGLQPKGRGCAALLARVPVDGASFRLNGSLV